MIWLLQALVVFGCRVVLADEGPNQAGAVRIEIQSGIAQPEHASTIPAGHWGPPQPLPAVPLVPNQPEFVESDTPSPPPQGSAIQSMTLEDLDLIALQSNPTLAQARMAIRAAQGGYVQAGLYPNPSVGYAGGDVGLEGTSGQQGVFVGQEIVTAGKLRLGQAVAGHAVQQAHYGWEAQRRRVMNGVRSGYYEVLLAQKMIEVNEELTRVSEEGVNALEQLRDFQEVSQADVLQARIEYEETKLSLEGANSVHRAAWGRLAAVLGRPDMHPASLVGNVADDLPVLNREDTLTTLLTQSPQLSKARAAVRGARCEWALQCAERKPNVEVELGIKHDETDWRTLADVTVGLALPLFDRNQGNIVAAQADLIAAQHEVRRIELELHDRFAIAFENYALAGRRAETYSATILPNAQESLKLVWEGYREGEFGYLAVLTAQRTFFNVNLEYLANLGELWTRAIALEGMLLEGGLEAVE